MKHNFENRKQNRIDFARGQVEKNEQKSEALLNSARQLQSVIPLGQPILVGHHSEKGHRRHLDKIYNTFGKAFEASGKAQHYKGKAQTIEFNEAIFSDDPDAIIKLKAKLKLLEEYQAFMKDANKAIRKKDMQAFLNLPFTTEPMWIELTTKRINSQIGFEGFTLSNNNANISRVRDRIKRMEIMATRISTEVTINGIRVYCNVEANRLQLFFPAIPSEENQKKLKKNGFRWCRSEGAWQRHLNNVAVSIAKALLQELN